MYLVHSGRTYDVPPSSLHSTYDLPLPPPHLRRYIVHSGRVTLQRQGGGVTSDGYKMRGGPRKEDACGPGDTIGEAAMLYAKAIDFTAVATGTVQVTGRHCRHRATAATAATATAATSTSPAPPLLPPPPHRLLHPLRRSCGASTASRSRCSKWSEGSTTAPPASASSSRCVLPASLHLSPASLIPRCISSLTPSLRRPLQVSIFKRMNMSEYEYGAMCDAMEVRLAATETA